MVQTMACVFYFYAMMRYLDQGMLCHERVCSWMVVTCDDVSGEAHIQFLSCGDMSEVGSYVACSHLRDATCGEVRSWWIACVGLRASRSVEQDYEQGGL